MNAAELFADIVNKTQAVLQQRIIELDCSPSPGEVANVTSGFMAASVIGAASSLIEQHKYDQAIDLIMMADTELKRLLIITMQDPTTQKDLQDTVRAYQVALHGEPVGGNTPPADCSLTDEEMRDLGLKDED